MEKAKKKIKTSLVWLPVALLIIFSFWTIRGLLVSGFFPIHDDTQVARVNQMALALKDKQFPVRWVKDLGYGYGYPLFNFYAPLAYYVGALFNLIGFNALASTKMMMGLGMVLGGITMYFLAKEFWGKLGGMISAVSYLYLPYKAVDLYVRGAIAELWALGFLPLVFLGVWLVFKEQRRGVVVGGLGLALVILSHNLTALMLTPFLISVFLVAFIFSQKKSLFSRHSVFLVLLGLSLSAFYWLPALREMNLTQVSSQLGGGADWVDHFVYLDQLWASPWGFAGSGPGRLDGMSFMVGKLHLILSGLVLLITFFSQRPQKKEKVYTWIGIGFFLVAVFFTSRMSASVWRLFPLMAFIQYPWRFLGFIGFFVAFLTGGIVLYLHRNSILAYLPAFFIIITLIALNSRYFKPQFKIQTSSSYYLEESNLKWSTSKISFEYLPKDFLIPQTPEEVAQKKVIVPPEANLKMIEEKSSKLVFNLQAHEQTTILVNLAYFPGWQVFFNQEKLIPEIKNGRFKLFIPPGNHQVKFVFANTPVRILGNSVSILGLVGLLLYAKIALWRRQK
jgi:hypothetical protein